MKDFCPEDHHYIDIKVAKLILLYPRRRPTKRSHFSLLFENWLHFLPLLLRHNGVDVRLLVFIIPVDVRRQRSPGVSRCRLDGPCAPYEEFGRIVDPAALTLRTPVLRTPYPAPPPTRGLSWHLHKHKTLLHITTLKRCHIWLSINELCIHGNVARHTERMKLLCLNTFSLTLRMQFLFIIVRF